MSARAELALAYLLGTAAFAAVALWAGQDANWDLQNYHQYAAYALLHWRYPLDVGPGAFQGYFNPLPYVPQYLLRAALPPIGVAVSLAAIQAIVVPVAWIITGRLPGLAGRPALQALATAVGCSAAMVVAEIGTSFADLLLAPLVLGGLCAALQPNGARRPWLWAGLLVGLATGLKLTNALYAPGLLAAAILPWRGWRPPAWTAVGLGAGAALTGGAWAGYLWLQFGNPVFPGLNNWFQSPSAELSAFTERRFLPTGALDALTYPLRIASGAHPTSEAMFADPRLLLALPLSLLAWGTAGRAVPFLWGSVLAWLGLFAIERYAVAIDLLAGIMLTQSVANLAGPRRGRACLATAVAVLALTRPADFWHRPWADAYTPAIPEALADPAAFLMVWHPDGYWAATLPSASRFYTIVPMGLATGGPLHDRLVRGLQHAPGGRVWTLGPDFPLGVAIRERLSALGYIPAAPCLRAPSLWWVDTVFCRAAPAGSRPLAAADLAADDTIDFSRAGAGAIYEVAGWLEAGARGVAAVGPLARLLLRPARSLGPLVLDLDRDGQAPLRVNGALVGPGPGICLPPGLDVDLTFGDADGPPLTLLLRTMRLRPAASGEC